MPVESRWIRTRSDELAVERGYTFDERAADHVREFLAKNCRHSIGEFAGRPLVLLDWQWSDFIAPLYGWKAPDGRRRFKSAYLQVGKKNGKSTLVSALSLYHLIGDREAVPRCYLLACDKKQAANLYEEASRMLAASERLKTIAEDIPTKALIACRHNRGQIEALSNVVETKDGFNASLLIFDELHRQKTDRLWNVMLGSGRTRRQPLRVAITTAGTTEDVERKSICFRQYMHAKGIIDGSVEDIFYLGVIYEPKDGENADLEDPATWRSANPSMGHTFSEETFEADLQTAKSDPSELADFKQRSLNIWVSNRERFLDKEAWDRCAGDPVDFELVRELPSYWGIDLASTIDVAALARLFVDQETETVHVLMSFWIPEDNAAKREDRDRVPYKTWSKRGLVTLTDGNVIDYKSIRRAISGDPTNGVEGLVEGCNLRMIGIDAWNAQQITQQLNEEDGLPVVTVRQGVRLSPATKELERLVLSGRLHHGANPVLDWMAGNAVVRRDAEGNLKLDKARSIEKIDGITALANAVAVMMSDTTLAEDNDLYVHERLTFL